MPPACEEFRASTELGVGFAEIKYEETPVRSSVWIPKGCVDDGNSQYSSSSIIHHLHKFETLSTLTFSTEMYISVVSRLLSSSLFISSFPRFFVKYVWYIA